MTEAVGRLASKLRHRRMRVLEAFGKGDAGLAAEGPLDFAWHSDARDKLDQYEITPDKREGTLELQPCLRVVGDLRALKATATVDQNLDPC